MHEKISLNEGRILALGGDNLLLSALCEQLPNAAPVTTPQGLQAQLQAGFSGVFLLDDSAPTALLEGLKAALQQPSGNAVAVLGGGNGDIFQYINSSMPLVLQKPVRVFELKRAVESLLKDLHEKRGKSIEVSPSCRVQPVQRLLENPGTGASCELTEKEFAILIYLLQQAGMVISRDELHKEIWGFRDNIATHTLETHLYRLRTKLREVAGDEAGIETTPAGYRLNAVNRSQ